MNCRGTVAEVGEVRTVSTQYGERDLAEVVLEAPEPTTVTLWGDWAETAERLQPGMDLLATDLQEDEFDGETRYATGRGSYVVVEPDYLVDVTDVRSWVQCPRMYYLNKVTPTPLNYPVVLGTAVHVAFGDLLRGRDREAAVEDAVADAGLDLGLLGRDPAAVAEEVDQHARAIEGWLDQGRLGDDEWRSEVTLAGERFGLKGRCDAVRNGAPVELKTGKNTKREPRFHDKVQAACYALLLGERDGEVPDTGTLLYTKNAALDRSEGGDLSPAKDFSVGRGLLEFVVRARNGIAAMESRGEVPTGHEADAICEYCFERETCVAVAGRLDQESKAGRVGATLPREERDYFERFYALIEAERRAVHGAYADLWRQGEEERAAADRALVDLDPAGRRQLDDGRWELRARGGGTSKIREGDVVLASDGHPTRGRAERARVERLGDEIVVTADEPVELRRLDVYPSELGPDRMLTALHDFVLRGSERRRDLVLGRADPAFGDGSDASGEYVPSNPAQDRAVARAVSAEDFALIHGPPGTGKTYTIARLVAALVEEGERVLLSGFTNRAVDNALAAVRDAGVEDVVRVGTERGVRGDARDVLLAGEHADAGRLRGASVVAATTTTCTSRSMREVGFDVAVVDEASQLTEPGTLAATERADRFVLVGDHRQLPPVVRADNDLSNSLFERLIEAHPEAAVTLDRQYRMAQAIQAFPSREFYGGALRPATPEIARQRVDEIADAGALPEDLRPPVSFHDVAGDAGDHTDANEAERVAEIVSAFEEAGVPREDVGVIAPFRAQVAEIDRRVPEGVTVDTVDRFQGSSEEVVVVSFVATGALEGPIFEDHRRLNVALTRAKRALVLVGSAAALRSEPLYDRMVEWAEGVE